MQCNELRQNKTSKNQQNSKVFSSWEKVFLNNITEMHLKKIIRPVQEWILKYFIKEGGGTLLLHE